MEELRYIREESKIGSGCKTTSALDCDIVHTSGVEVAQDCPNGLFKSMQSCASEEADAYWYSVVEGHRDLEHSRGGGRVPYMHGRGNQGVHPPTRSASRSAQRDDAMRLEIGRAPE
jgi:hypothetical protein